MAKRKVEITNLNESYTLEEKRKQIETFIKDCLGKKNIRGLRFRDILHGKIELNSIFVQMNFVFNTRIEYGLFELEDSIEEVIEYIIEECLIVKKRGIKSNLYI